MNGSTPRQCPRCQSDFDCKAGSDEPCQCNGIALTDEHRHYIASLYRDCLCASCLVELRRRYNLSDR